MSGNIIRNRLGGLFLGKELKHSMYRIRQGWTDQGCLRTSASGILQTHLPTLQINTSLSLIQGCYTSTQFIGPKIYRLALLTLTAQIKHSSDAVFAIIQINSVFALVLLSGLVDLKPKPFICHPRLDPLWSSNLGISNGGGMAIKEDIFFLFYFLLESNIIKLLDCLNVVQRYNLIVQLFTV